MWYFEPVIKIPMGNNASSLHSFFENVFSKGGSKSIVFVLPHVNTTAKYFRNQADGEVGEEDESTDIVPFPKNWKLKTIRLRVPTFNTTDADQYGQELEQVCDSKVF